MIQWYILICHDNWNHRETGLFKSIIFPFEELTIFLTSINSVMN